MHCRILILSAAAVMLIAGAAAADIVCVPDPLTLSVPAPTDDLVVNYTGGGSANLYGYKIHVQWDPAVATAHEADFTRPDSGPFSTSVFFQVIEDAAGHVQVHAAIGAGHPGITSGDLFKAVFTAVGAPGSNTDVELVIEELRDSGNNDITGVTADDGQILISDLLPVVSNVVIANTTLAHTDDYLKNTDAITVTAVVTDDDPAFGATNITADLSPLGGGTAANPSSYVANTATWTVASATCTPPDGVTHRHRHRDRQFGQRRHRQRHHHRRQHAAHAAAWRRRAARPPEDPPELDRCRRQ